MTDAEILEKLREYFQNQINNLNATEMAEGPFDDGTEDGALWEQAASRIDARGGLRVRFEFGDEQKPGCCPDCGAVGYGNASCRACHREWRKTWHKPCAICREDEPTLAVAQQREERAVAEARPHEEKPDGVVYVVEGGEQGALYAAASAAQARDWINTYGPDSYPGVSLSVTVLAVDRG